VDLEADAVACSVGEVLVAAPGRDDAARFGVNVLGCHARRDKVRRPLVCLANQIVYAPEFRVWLNAVRPGHPDGAGRVAHVARQRAADVQNDRLAGLDAAVAGVVVGRSTVRSGSHDREVGDVVTLVRQTAPDFAAHLRLGPADQRSGGDRLDGPVGGGSGEVEQPRLVCILDFAQVAHDHAGRLEVAARQCPLQLQDVHRP